jgi:uncharacterized membrane protein YeiB
VTPSTPTPRRLTGVDIARALAILGMVTVHFGPSPVTGIGPGPWIYGSFSGKASVLFVLVAGVGVALLERRQPAQTVRARMVYRAAWLFPVGIALGWLDHPVAVILHYYGAYFLFLVPFVGLKDRAVLAWAGTLTVVGAAVVLAVQVTAPGFVLPLGGRAPFGALGEVVVFGYYPAITWLPVMLLGLWLGRRDLRSARLQAGLVVVGTATLAATTGLGRLLEGMLGVEVSPTSWSWAVTVEGHSEMPLAVLGAAGFAVAVLGACLLAASAAPRLTRPLAASGEVALTVYVGHLVVFDRFPALFPAQTVAEGIRTVLAFGVVVAVLAVAWLRIMPRGPLEAVVRWPWQHVIAPLVRPQPVPAATPPAPDPVRSDAAAPRS